MKSGRARISRDEARAYLLGHLGLRAIEREPGARGVRNVLRALRCIQLDPLDPMGQNADFVALARVDGIARGDVYRHVYPGHAFEHFAKERCLLPAEAFPYYKGKIAQTPWWNHRVRIERLPKGVLRAVEREIEEHGPLAVADLTDHGQVAPLDWSGWMGTARAASMAVEVLWTRCDIVVCGRSGRGKLYDVPSRALPTVANVRVPARDFARWALLGRVEAAGLLSRAGGPLWSTLTDVRTSRLPDTLVREGALVEVEVEGSSRPYLAPAGFLDRPGAAWDGRMRILGPLDPLLWDRKLVANVFGFEYVWEVYKPQSERRWGWYVCPLLHDDALVGRIDGRMRDGALCIDRIWSEEGVTIDDKALGDALARHARACGATDVRLPRDAKRRGRRAPRRER